MTLLSKVSLNALAHCAEELELLAQCQSLSSTVIGYEQAPLPLSPYPSLWPETNRVTNCPHFSPLCS